MKMPTAEQTETTTTGETAATAERVETTVGVELAGHIRSAVGAHRTEFTFEGEALQAFLGTFFAAYDVRNLVIARRKTDTATRGQARIDRLPGTWRENPKGEQTQLYARVLVNGMFNENSDGSDTRFEGDDRVALMESFLCCV